MDYLIIGVIVWLGFVFGSSLLYAKAMKKLSIEKKAELIDRFGKFRSYSLLIVIGIAVAYFVILRQNFFDYRTVTIGYFVLFVIYLIVVNVYSYNILKKNNFSLDFIRVYVLSVVIRFAGFIVFFSFLLNYF